MKLRNFSRPFIPVFALICRLTLAIIFLYAGIEKLINPGDFAVAIYNYRLLPDNVINFVAVLLPWLEVIIAISLISGTNARGAALLSALLFLTFATALTINLMRGLDISCGCFGTSSGNINWSYLVRDLSLFCMSVFVMMYDRGWRYFFV
ncbi:MAG: MauE/DoxX family redox-associated membrane protein [Smithella sp.]